MRANWKPPGSVGLSGAAARGLRTRPGPARWMAGRPIAGRHLGGRRWAQGRVYAFVDYNIRVHPNQHVPIGLRVQTLGAGLIGLGPIVFILVQRWKPVKAPAGAEVDAIAAIGIVSVFIIMIATLLLLLLGGNARGLPPCHADYCSGV